MGGFITFQSVLLWRYNNDKKAYHISAVPFKMSARSAAMAVWLPHHERWAYTSKFVQSISGFWMYINDEMRPKYITLYSYGSCVKSWPDLMAKQNWYTKHFHKNTITSSYTPSKTKIPITILKAQIPSNPNQKSRTRDNKRIESWREMISCDNLAIWSRFIFSDLHWGYGRDMIKTDTTS